MTNAERMSIARSTFPTAFNSSPTESRFPAPQTEKQASLPEADSCDLLGSSRIASESDTAHAQNWASLLPMYNE